jgi:hypothetical protein
MNVTPCKDCKDRFIECHITCERYKAFKEELNVMKANIASKKSLEFDLADRTREGISKMLRTKKH